MNPIIQKEQSLKQGEDIPLKIQINPVKSNTLTKKKKNTIYTKFEKHLLAIPAKQFGVQLLGGSDEEAILEFIEKYDFKNKVNYYHRHVKGEDWYVLIYGHFNSLKDAQQAINDLPEELRELNPWVRSYESIHKVIQNK
ncbi:MAG: Cell division protein DamX [Legionellaceae bacterium]